MLRDTPGEVLVCCDLSYYGASRGHSLTGELCPPAWQRRSPEGGPLSSAILYGAIVVIWAGVLIPRWLRRETSVEEAPVVTELTDVAVPEPSPVAPPEPVKEERLVRRGSEKARVIAARRRLLGMLVLLAIGAGVLAVM